MGVFRPSSYTARAFQNPSVTGDPSNYNLEEVRTLEIPGANGHATARFVAAFYNAFATAANKLANPLGFSEDAIKEMQRQPPECSFDETMLMDTNFTHGFSRPFPNCHFGS